MVGCEPPRVWWRHWSHGGVDQCQRAGEVPQLRDRAVRMVFETRERTSGPLTRVAQRLGVNPETLRNG